MPDVYNDFAIECFSTRKRRKIIDKKLIDLMEDQINKELYSAYLYYDIAEYYRSKGLDGFHKRFEDQAREEIEHAEKFAEYLHDNDVAFKLKTIAAPENDFKNLREPLVLQNTHEKYVTSLIHQLYDCAEKVGDTATKHFLGWYVNEQIEEEKTAKDLLEQYDLYAKDGGIGLYQVNKDLLK